MTQNVFKHSFYKQQINLHDIILQEIYTNLKKQPAIKPVFRAFQFEYFKP